LTFSDGWGVAALIAVVVRSGCAWFDEELAFIEERGIALAVETAIFIDLTGSTDALGVGLGVGISVGVSVGGDVWARYVVGL
jgi:hypothetical protein